MKVTFEKFSFLLKLMIPQIKKRCIFQAQYGFRQILVLDDLSPDLGDAKLSRADI